MNNFSGMRFFTGLCFLCLLASCRNQDDANNDTQQSKEVGADALFYDYSITAQDDQPDVAVRLQYRVKNRKGKLVILDTTDKAWLDSSKMDMDSARFAGFFYEKILPLQSFAGKHTIIFIDKLGKQNKTEFAFTPFGFAKELPEKIKRQPVDLELRNLINPNGFAQLVITDTAFYTNDINEEVQLNDGKLTITPQMWNELKDGPITLEINVEEEKLLKRNGKTNGRLVMNYTIKRQLELTE